jgi:hypothetical protein
MPPILGDSVGVVEAWVPTLTGANDPVRINAALDEVAKQDWRYHNTAKDWVGNAIAEALGLDVDDKTDRRTLTEVINKWKAAGYLKIVNKLDTHREPKEFVEIKKRPASVFDDEEVAAVPPEF